MPRLSDTHCHLFMEPLGSSVKAVLARARIAGVTRFLVPSVSRADWQECAALAERPGVACALGVHPWHADEGVDISELERAVKSSGAVAIGEIGLDWKCPVDRTAQNRVFRDQLELARSLSLPVSIHCRGAFAEMLDILEACRVQGAVHAWSRSPELMDRFLRAGLYISFGGAVTRKGAVSTRASAEAVPANRFILETDSPSIGLEGIAAGDSEPAHLLSILQSMSDLRGDSPEAVSNQAWINSISLFGEWT